MQIFYQDYKNKIGTCKFCKILPDQTLHVDPQSGSVIRIRNPYPQVEIMLSPDPYPDPH
jgi:hypothetical protein